VSSSASSRRLRGAHLRLALLPLACVLDVPDACANDRDDVEFDAGMLKLRGIDPRLADYFREAPRFTAGLHAVSLRVNGQSVGRASARFDQQGRLCVDRGLADAANIEVPRSSLERRDASAATCIDLMSLLPRANVALDPSRGEVSLLVPTDALRVETQDVSGYARGGKAAMLNYDIVALDSRFGARRSRFGSANMEVGFNAGDWIVRSRQMATSTDGRYRAEALDTYAQRSFAGQRAVLQLGELNVINPALSGAQIIGAQVMSEQALVTQDSSAVIEGIAPSQARVEVRQDGVLVYSTVVPAGPFALTDTPRINRRANLDVTVIGADGESQHFIVSPVVAGIATPSPGYSFAVGKTRNAGSMNAPWVASAGWSGSIRRRYSLSTGVILASSYQSVGTGAGWSPTMRTQVQLDIAASRTVRDHTAGAQATLTVSRRFGEGWSLAFSSTRQSLGFRELLDTARFAQRDSRHTRYRDQSSASLSWSRTGWGNLGTGYSRTVLFNGRTTRRALASWGTRLGRASVSLAAEWSLGQTRRTGNNSIYLNASIPLGENRRLATTIRRYEGETRYGTNFSERINEFASYRAGFEYRSGDHRRSLTAAVSLLPRYVQLDAGYSRDARSGSTSLALRGGLVAHGHGVTASPYAVRDTFGVISVGDSAGVRVSTPGGPVWTDARGYAVLPQLSPYGKSGIEVATDSLPRNVDIHNGASVIQVARGAVTTLDFGVSRTRRLLIRAADPDGKALPFGATVTDGHGDVVGVVQANGEIFVPNALATPRLQVSGPGMAQCELDIGNSIGERPDQGAYYETSAMVCRLAGGSGR